MTSFPNYLCPPSPWKTSQHASKMSLNLSFFPDTTQVSFDEFMDKLGKFEDQLEKQEPPSAVYEIVLAQRQENEELRKELTLQDPSVEKLVQNGQQVVEALEDAPEREAMEQKINELKTRWQATKAKVEDRQTHLNSVEAEAQKFRQEADSLSALVTDVEENVREFEPLSVNMDNIAKQKDLLQQVLSRVDKLKTDIRDVAGSADELKEDAEKDIPVVEAEVEDLVARIEKLSASLDDRATQVTAIEEASHEYHVTVQKVEDVFSEAFDVVDAPVVCGTNTETACQHLAKIKVSYCDIFWFMSTGFFGNVRSTCPDFSRDTLEVCVVKHCHLVGPES